MSETCIIEMVKRGYMPVEQALQELTEFGFSPHLLHDDNGHWAITFTAYQNVALNKKPEAIEIAFLIEAEFWKNTIKEAFLYTMGEQ